MWVERGSMSRPQTRMPLRRPLLALTCATAVMLAQVSTWTPVGSIGPVSAEAATAAPQKPNRFDPTSRATSVTRPPSQTGSPAGGQPALRRPSPRDLPFAAPRELGRLTLDPATDQHLVGSGGALEIDAPAGTVTAADISAAGGAMSLLVRQVEPASGSNAGGSGRYRFGTFLIQVLDARGQLAGRGLRQPVSVKLHYSGRAAALDLRDVVATLNAQLPATMDMSPSRAPTAAAPTTPASGARTQTPSTGPSAASPLKLGPLARQRASVDPASGTLAATVGLSSPSSTLQFNTDGAIAAFGRPDPFETNLSGGALTAGYPIDLPAGPGGLTPPLQLSYNSAGVSDQHNPQGAAPWVGEGWSMGMGAISWSEHQVRSSCGSCPPLWEDSWQLSDAYGTGADLVPPGLDTTTFWHDGSSGQSPSPTVWHTAPESRAKVISFNGPVVLPNAGGVPTPCFRVFLVSGIMEEFGCTVDSILYYQQPVGVLQNRPYIASWLLDLITDPSGNQIHVTYQRDDVATSVMTYRRDLVLGQVEYDSPGCHDPQTACTGSAWAPLMRVNFVAGHTVAHVAGGSCAASGSLRCDDPVDLSASGGLRAPTVQSTFVLDDIQVQVRPSPDMAWNTLRDYQLSFDQGAAHTVPDPMSGLAQSVAAGLLLRRLQVIGADGTTTLPARTFDYTSVTEYYEDVLGLPSPASNCGPAWNNGNTPNGHTGCILWSQSWDANSSYLSRVSNGLGLSETFSWRQARSNAHGVSGGSPADPFACVDSGASTPYPCNMPDDESWSRAVLVQRTDSVLRQTQAGSTPVDSTWTYG